MRLLACRWYCIPFSSRKYLARLATMTEADRAINNCLESLAIGSNDIEQNIAGNDSESEHDNAAMGDTTTEVLVDNNDIGNDSIENGQLQVDSTVTVPLHERSGIPYRDHYSLAYPSSTVRFRSSATSYRVYQGNKSQFVLEERNRQITVKQTSDTTGGVMFLRGVYTVVAVLWSGFLFVFCTQLLIFLVMNLAVYLGGTTGSHVAAGRAIGTILSLPVYVHGLASALIIAGHFIADIFAGQYLLKTLVFGRVGAVVTAWITFGFFLGFPLLIMGICLFANVADWWSITAIFWFSSVSIFYVLFAVVVVFFEIKACLEIVGHVYDCKSDNWTLLKNCVWLRQVKTYSGEKSRIYLARGSLNDSNVGHPIAEDSIHYRESLYSRLTEWSFFQRVGMFKRLEGRGQRTYPVEESQGVRPFVTYATWR